MNPKKYSEDKYWIMLTIKGENPREAGAGFGTNNVFPTRLNPEGGQDVCQPAAKINFPLLTPINQFRLRKWCAYYICHKIFL